ncbi:hypothetical protein DSO57_1023186 [Entomophthora muscae]|uniref:Uncharacterized protein n=1 Tax=Entomophthora muscae TaxID=34485 RepID=A0ACC2T3E5_9FUNG|nr:hypothetical protein DSO57_1023186 [Entomophthora muscae]
MSYLIKLAPILWWALPTQSATRQFPDSSKPASQGWFPDTPPPTEGRSPLGAGCQEPGRRIGLIVVLWQPGWFLVVFVSLCRVSGNHGVGSCLAYVS